MDGVETDLGQAYRDALVGRLRDLRARVGEPSYADIAQRVTAQRVDDGTDPHAARVARTTVYDAFRPGRARLNVEFVREIARALGADESTVAAWVADPRPTTSVTPDRVTPCAPTTPTAPPTTSTEAPPAPPVAVRGHVVALLLACVGLNLMGRELVDLLHLPVYLDMVGTAIVAIAVGPWAGAAVGVTTNVVGTLSSGAASLPFALVNVAGALVWGYGARRLGWGRTLPRFLALNVGVALVCTAVSVPILVLVFGGSVGHGQNDLAATLADLTDTLLVAVGLANLLTSVGDKLISGFVALVVISALPPALRAGSGLVTVAGPDSAGEQRLE